MRIDLGWHFPRNKESLSILELIVKAKAANIRKGKDVTPTLILSNIHIPGLELCLTKRWNLSLQS